MVRPSRSQALLPRGPGHLEELKPLSRHLTLWAQGNKDDRHRERVDRNAINTHDFNLRNKAEAQLGNTEKEHEVFHSAPLQTFHTHRHFVPSDIQG